VRSIPTLSIKRVGHGADAYFKHQVWANLGFSRFWSQWQIAFDEPFRSYVAADFAAAGTEQW
jgi:hypothetical protein